MQRAFESNGQRCIGRTGVGGSNGGTDFWNEMWRVECPPKVKQSHNTLALKRVLKRTGVKTDTLCYFCNRLDEEMAGICFSSARGENCMAQLTKPGRGSGKLMANVSARQVIHGKLICEPTGEGAAHYILSCCYGCGGMREIRKLKGKREFPP